MGSTVKKKEANPGLLNIVFSWSINEIMNKDLYRNQVNHIEDTFSSANDYLNSFKTPLIEETHADLRSNMAALYSAPVLEIKGLQEGQDFKPPESLYYDLELEKVEEGSDVYEPQIGDLIALTEVRPKRIDDLNGRRFSYVVALVKGMRDEDTNLIPIVSSKLIILDELNQETRGTLFAVYLINMTTNLRIWKSLHPSEGGNVEILNSVLRVNPSVEDKCGLCSLKEESSDLLKSKVLIMSLGLDDSQRNAVLKCIALRGCNHRNSVELIWGPPGTGKTKTIASLLFSLFRIKCRTLICAPTNVAVLTVAKRLLSYLNGRLEFDTFGLGDVVLSGNGKRMKIVEHEDVHDVFLDFRISALLYCFKPLDGWNGSVNEMIRLLEDPETKYEHYLQQLKEAEERESGSENENGEVGEDVGEKGSLKEKVQKDFLRKLLIQNVKQNKKKSKKQKQKQKKEVDSQERKKSKAKVEEIPFTFEEYFSDKVFRLGEQICLCTELLYTHMPTSCLVLNDIMNMIRVVDVLQTLENFLCGNVWSKKDLIGSESSLYGIKHKCLEVLNLVRTVKIPEFYEPFEVRNYCLANACLIFCTVSSSSKLHTQGIGAPFELVIIDEAAQVKECESMIPLQLPALPHAILVGDEKQLPAMVISEFCQKAGFGRSLFERLVMLGHSKHLLNVQYRMHPSISLFPNKEFYANQIRNGPNVTEITHERQFLKDKMFGSYSFINVANGKEEFDNRHSRRNFVEVSVVAEILSKLYKESMKSKGKVRVGCISPYKAQVFAMQESLGKTYSSDTKEKFSVNVRSVDGFQGGEEDIIIISTVRCNGKGSVGFLENPQRVNVALTRARHCLWILGSSATLENSGTVWTRLVVDAKNRGCFHNAYEDSKLSGAINNALIMHGHQRSLFTEESILFKTAAWKVRFSAEFHESITRYGDAEIQMEVISLVQKLASGWRKDEGGGGASSNDQVLQCDVVKGPLRLVWAVDILRENYSTDTQVLSIIDLLPESKVAQVAVAFEDHVGNCTVNQLKRCLCERNQGGLRLPMTWPVEAFRNNYSTNDLSIQFASISLRNDLTPPRRRNRNATKWRKKNYHRNPPQHF